MIQGSAADCTKLAGVYFFKEIIKQNLFGIVKIVNMIHDEYNVEAPEEISENVSKLLIKCMSVAGDQFCKEVKLTATCKIDDHWVH